MRSSSIPRFLRAEILHLALIIDSPPDIQALAANVGDHLIDMPAPLGRTLLAIDIPGNPGTEPDRPAADLFVAYIGSAPGHQLFEMPQAEREPEIQPGIVSETS